MHQHPVTNRWVLGSLFFYRIKRLKFVLLYIIKYNVGRLDVSENKKKKTIAKSSQLFFTTIMLVVLLVVGLSTATFAWFSSNIEVRSNELIFTAKNVAGANIYITWDDPETIIFENLDATALKALRTIEFSDPEEIVPMVPNVAPVKGTTNVIDFANSFYGATTNVQIDDEDPDDEDPLVFNMDGYLEKPYIGNNGVTQDYFYIINGDATATNVSALVTIKGDNLSLLRVALFVEDEFKGIVVANNIDPNVSATHYGEIKYGEDATTNGFEKIANEEDPISFEIPGTANEEGKDNYVKVAIVCWYDGVWLDESGQTKTASVSLIFKANSANNG